MRHKASFTPTERQQMVRLYQDGTGVTTIGKRMECFSAIVCKILREESVDVRQSKRQ